MNRVVKQMLTLDDGSLLAESVRALACLINYNSLMTDTVLCNAVRGKAL